MTGYAAAVLADNPVHYWRCNDSGGGLVLDLGTTPVALHGLGTAISQPLGYSGPNFDGGSMDLVLDGQYANTGQAQTLSINPFSFEMLYWGWQRMATVSQLWQIQSANQVALFRNTNTWSFIYNGVVVSRNTNYVPQRWVHIVCTYDGANARIYVDNTLGGPTAVAAQAALAGILEISTNQGLTTWGNGFYSEIAYYTTALSAARVAAHFNAIDSAFVVPRPNQSGGSPSGDTATLSQILASVRKTY